MYLEPLPQRFPIPQIDTTARWGRRTRSLQRDPSMVALTHGLWAQWDGIIAPTDLQPWEVSALIASAVPHAAVSGLCAAAALQIPLMWGMNWVDGVLGQARTWTPWNPAPEIVVPNGHKLWRGNDVVVRKLAAHHTLQSGPWGSQVTAALPTLLALQKWQRGWRAVVAADNVLARAVDEAGQPLQLQPGDLMAQLHGIAPGTRGKALLFQALNQAAPNVWSPMETVLRLVVIKLGAPPPAHNLPVVLSSGRKVYLDLAWKQRRKALEYNGKVHHLNWRQYRDEAGRLNELRDDGWDVRVVVMDDLQSRQRLMALRRWLRDLH
ncbi:hypothetical protein [Kocuria sp. ZOR0020]|uniref:hypothetical protein n=1 Tax=Kocuria sp. ZOR0020 TaxID=1339234 RepID=UPI0012E07E47|nr:hypothetical protein [Kocuria sp. ZOR0020]